jgi:hypothetical protein
MTTSLPEPKSQEKAEKKPGKRGRKPKNLKSLDAALGDGQTEVKPTENNEKAQKKSKGENADDVSTANSFSFLKFNDIKPLNGPVSLDTGLTKDEEFGIFLGMLPEFVGKNKKALFTASLKMELYVSEDSWKKASILVRNLLNTFIHKCDRQMESILWRWIKIRYNILKCIDSSESQANLFTEAFKHIQIVDIAGVGDAPTKQEILPGHLKIRQEGWSIPEGHLKMNLENLGREKPKSAFEPIRIPKPVDKGELAKILGIEGDFQSNARAFTLPLYLIDTRDSFAYDLIEKTSIIMMRGRPVLKTEFFFDPRNYPANFDSYLKLFPDYRCGVTTYNNFFSHDELRHIEELTYETEKKCFADHYLPMTGQTSFVGPKVKRTKFFFGARYMWSRQQLSEPNSYVGAGRASLPLI